jgi:hypothetical protein
MKLKQLSVEDTQTIELKINPKEKNNNKPKSSPDKIKDIIAIISVFILLVIAVFVVCNLVFSKTEKISNNTTQTTILSEGEIIIDKDVNLNNYASNITIKDGGEYTISGSLKYSVIIDSDSNVTLDLNNVNIASTASGAIINKGTGNLIINLVDNSDNKLSDGGTSSYNAVIYSSSLLTINGTGKLTITSNQENGAGIETETSDLIINGGTYIITSQNDGLVTSEDGGTITINNGSYYIDAKGYSIDSNKDIIINDGSLFLMGGEGSGKAGINATDGYNINGGTLVSLGSDMLELPLDTSKQNSMCFKLKDYVNPSSIVSLLNWDSEIVTFKSTKKFNTAIISAKNLYHGTYTLYKDGTDGGSAIYGFYETGKYTKGTKINSYELSNVVGSYEEK